MKNPFNPRLKPIKPVLTGLVLVLSIALQAQILHAPPPPPGLCDPPDDSVPLDGGLSVLLLGAAAFGLKKLRDKQR